MGTLHCFVWLCDIVLYSGRGRAEYELQVFDNKTLPEIFEAKNGKDISTLDIT
jgi:hypothetical protein